MPTSPLKEFVDNRARLMPLSVEQYQRMIETGILPEGEPYELIEGYVVRKDRSAAGSDPMSVGHHHAWVVQKLARLDRDLEGWGRHMRVQQPVALPPYDEPEPDGAVVRADVDDYRERHPRAEDVLCLIEVADAPRKRDRTMKQRIYASAGIDPYVIVNLPERVVEVHAQPVAEEGRYGRCDALGVERSVAFPTAAGEPLVVPVRDFLP